MEPSFTDRLLWRGTFSQQLVYSPKKRPGFAAWVTGFTYGDGTIGISFDEIISEENPDFVPPRLEYAEAAGVPVSYASAEYGSAQQHRYRVYMRSEDGVRFTETGRCSRREGSLCNVGFADGRIIGFDVPRYNDSGTGWENSILVRESQDGGNTWSDIRRLLSGTAPYLWRVRRLRNGTIVVLASLYGTPWGIGQLRPTRNTMLPGETYLNKIQPFFMTSRDGRGFSQPNYILPGIGAHEFDFVELPDERLLFIAGDVQGTPTGRQFVMPSPDGWINGPLLPIRTGAPVDSTQDPQGGIIPETIVWDDTHRCIVGYRRNKCFSLSTDYGENWVALKLNFQFDFLYQPHLLSLKTGEIGLYGHVGGDNAFGERDMTIQAQLLRLNNDQDLPQAAQLSLERLLEPGGKRYLNAFRACLTSNGTPLSDQELEFRFSAYWKDDGTVNAAVQADAPDKIRVRTDRDGWATAAAVQYDNIGDIHLAYNADVVFHGSDKIHACAGPTITALALTPYRKTAYPYDAYFAGGTLYLAPQFIQDFPQTLKTLKKITNRFNILPKNLLCPEAVQRLLDSGVLKRAADGELRWIHSVHAPHPLNDVQPMSSADWYT